MRDSSKKEHPARGDADALYKCGSSAPHFFLPFLKKMLDFRAWVCYYNTRKRENPQKLKGELKMSYNFYEVHAEAWEAEQAYWEEVENLALMDADWEASDGHLWD